MPRRHETIDEYIGGCAEAVRPLLEELRLFIKTEMSKAREGMQYGAPVFFNAHGTPVIYLFGSKKHVNFGFLKSAELSDPERLLKGSGNPSKHIRIRLGNQIDKAVLSRFIKQCEQIEPDS